MTKHKKSQNGIFWNILEYSGTLYRKSQSHQLYSFLYKQKQQQQQQKKKRIFLADLTYNCAKCEIVCSRFENQISVIRGKMLSSLLDLKENNQFHFISISFAITQKVNYYEMQIIG